MRACKCRRGVLSQPGADIAESESKNRRRFWDVRWIERTTDDWTDRRTRVTRRLHISNFFRYVLFASARGRVYYCARDAGRLENRCRRRGRLFAFCCVKFKKPSSRILRAPKSLPLTIVLYIVSERIIVRNTII